MYDSLPRLFILPFFLILPRIAFVFVELVGKERFEGILPPHILLSQRPDPMEKQVISLDQDVHVCEYFWWMVDEFIFMNQTLLYF